jgi:hypothetical protein
MRREDFYIGIEFYCNLNKYRCTDIGTRTIIAIRIDSVLVKCVNSANKQKEFIHLNQQEAEKNGWFIGPPYGIQEIVFTDEDDLPDCSLE